MDGTIEIDGLKLSYYRSGNVAQPVIAMHGWGCKASTIALLAAAATGPDTTVYNLDLPGFGDSDEPPASWGIMDYTRFVEAFADRMGIERPVLIGHSFGGRIAIAYAAERPTSKLILVDAAGIKPRRSLKYYLKIYSFKAAKHILPLVAGKTRGARIIDRMRGKAGSSDYAAASPVMRAIMSRVVNEDLTHKLSSIPSPTLLIWGEEDTATPLSDAKKMERLIPDAGLVSYPGCGHYSFLERPAQTRAVIENFLNIKR